MLIVYYLSARELKLANKAAVKKWLLIAVCSVTTMGVMIKVWSISINLGMI